MNQTVKHNSPSYDSDNVCLNRFPNWKVSTYYYYYNKTLASVICCIRHRELGKEIRHNHYLQKCICVYCIRIAWVYMWAWWSVSSTIVNSRDCVSSLLCTSRDPLCWILHSAPVLPPPSFFLLCLSLSSSSSVSVALCSLFLLFMLVIPRFLAVMTVTEFLAVSLQFAVVNQCHHILVPRLGGAKGGVQGGSPHN